MKKTWGIVIVICLSQDFVFAQSLLKRYEKVLYTFKTIDHKTILLSLDTLNNIIAYRYGNLGNIETEVIDKLNDTSTVFTYHYYLREGGTENEGIDMNYIEFVEDNILYSIFSEYSATDNSNVSGVRISDLNLSREMVINAVPKTEKGSLADFRSNLVLPIRE